MIETVAFWYAWIPASVVEEARGAFYWGATPESDPPRQEGTFWRILVTVAPDQYGNITHMAGPAELAELVRAWPWAGHQIERPDVV